MTSAVETWIVVADGDGARVFEERRRLGPLVERADLAVRSQEDRHLISGRHGTVSGRQGHSQHATGMADPGSAAEARFLSGFAKGLDTAADEGMFEHLVIIAPPEALGALRASLKPSTRRRLEACDPHERHGEDAEALRMRLRTLRGVV